MNPDEIRELIQRAAATATEAFGSEEARERYIDFYDDDLTLTGYPPGLEGKDGARTFYMAFFEAIDGGRIELEDLIVEGDTAAFRFRLTGTHAGELMGVPPSGNAVDVTGQSFIKVRDGKFVERHQAFDNVTLMQQIGAMPAPA
jgi:predicted ester cyclase